MRRSSRWGRAALSLVVCAMGTLPVLAQDLAPQLAGRLDSSWSWVADGAPGGGQSFGLVTGWAGLTAGTKDVKSEVRLGLASLPTPAVDLDRAWMKFRFPGQRYTGGLGRVAWGPGFVLVPGDLMFDSMGTELDWQADELRSAPAWLADGWWALGDEAYAEALVMARSVGVRASAAPLGITLEAATAWDDAARRAKVAVSTQFHAGLDWYATLRQDMVASTGWTADGWTASAGAFGLWKPFDGIGVSTRHEALVPGLAPQGSLRTYHDASLTLEGGWAFTARALWTSQTSTLAPSVEVRWVPLQNLGLYAVTTLAAPWAVRLGSTARW